MKLLFTLTRHNDIRFDGTKLRRIAYRSIIQKNDLFLFVKSEKYGEYKFPGGGKDFKEKAFDVLRRETLEETGYTIKSKIIPFGQTEEYAKDFLGEVDLFHQTSKYYRCDIFDNLSKTSPDDYEIEYGYKAYWVSLVDAITNNESLPSNDLIPWKERDTFVMKLLLEMGTPNESERIY